MYSLVRQDGHFEMIDANHAGGVGESLDLGPLRRSAAPVWRSLSPAEKQPWNRFVRTGLVEPGLVRSSILASWERCRKKEVDPTAGRGADYLPLGKLEARHGRLADVSSPLMETLYHCVRGTGFVVVLMNPEGYILRILGDPKTLLHADPLGFGPGANWSEDQVGTNAIGTALALRRPIEVTGTEHYCESHHPWTCSAAPILDPNGNLLGCLDMSGPRENAHPHIMGMVLAAVRAIENRFGLELSHAQLDEAHRHLLAIFDSVSDGVITVNAQGRITNANCAAARIARRLREGLLGEDIASVLGVEDLLAEVLSEGRGPWEKEVPLGTPAGTVRCVLTANPVFSEGGREAGAVIALREVQHVRPALKSQCGSARYTFGDIVGESRSLRDVVERARIVADGPSTVLLLGESGTGKELFAQAIHNASGRSHAPFVAVNCAAIPRELIQSELFGYEPGAFTGAQRGGRAGKLEAADGGTLFLDEIGDMPLEMQSNLLRVLEERAVVRVGGNKVTPVDVRLVAATHRDLQEKVEAGAFREDLYYRLTVIAFTLPPLRERIEDVPLLVERHVGLLSHKIGKGISKVHEDVFAMLSAYSWPGNVRELVNMLEQAVNLAEGDEILTSHLPALFHAEALVDDRTRPPPAAQSSEGGTVSLTSLGKWAIEQALVRYRGNMTKVSEALGISRTTLYRKIREYGIRR